MTPGWAELPAAYNPLYQTWHALNNAGALPQTANAVARTRRLYRRSLALYLFRLHCRPPPAQPLMSAFQALANTHLDFAALLPAAFSRHFLAGRRTLSLGIAGVPCELLGEDGSSRAAVAARPPHPFPGLHHLPQGGQYGAGRALVHATCYAAAPGSCNTLLWVSRAGAISLALRAQNRHR